MAPKLKMVLDTSVLIKAMRTEDGHEAARDLVVLTQQRPDLVTLFEPVDFKLEYLVASRRRGPGSGGLDAGRLQTRGVGALVASFTHLTMEEVDRFVAECDTVYPATAGPMPGVKGADLVFLLVARQCAATLVTADKPLLRFARAVGVPVVTANEALTLVSARESAGRP